MVAIIVGVVGVLYRYLGHTTFLNDQYIHLAKAQAWLAGDWPIRDFTDPGMILTIGASAAAQVLLGETLWPELLLSVLAFGIAAGVTCWLTTRLTDSRVLAVLSAFLQIFVLPRLYSYPKILLYPILLLLIERYSVAPSWRRLAALTGWTAVAFLFRHDHGVYAAAAVVITLVIVHWGDGGLGVLRPIGTFGLLLVLCLAPFLLYVQVEAGLTNYFRLGMAFSQTEDARTRLALPRFVIEPGPLYVWQPPDLEGLPRIHIRWAPRIQDAERVGYERSVPLFAAEHVEGQTWRYRVDPDRRDALGALLNRSDVEDVAGVDRRTLKLEAAESAWHFTMRRLGVRALSPGPGLTSVVSDQNAVPALFYASWAIPSIAGVLWYSLRRQVQRPSTVCFHASVPAMCALGAFCAMGFLRQPLVARVPDTFGTIPLLLAWMTAALFGISAGVRRIAARALAIAVMSVVIVAVVLLGNTVGMVGRMVLEGPRALVARARDTTRSLRQWPWLSQWPGADWRVLKYVHDCTGRGDRLLVTWAGSEYYVFSRRPFAGRESALMPLSRAPQTYEPQVLETLERQSVPIVLADAMQYAEFATAYPAVAAHIAQAYQPVATTSTDSGRPIVVYVQRGRVPTGRHASSGWPCFAAPGENRERNPAPRDTHRADPH